METSKKGKKLTFRNIVLALLVAVSLYGVGSTYALFQIITEAKNNTFMVGSVDVSVIEKGNDHEDSTNNTENYDAIKKGKTVEKIVSIKNRKNDAYVRVILQPEFVNADGSATLIDTPDVTYNFKSNTNWKKSSDGTYYYTKALTKDATSEVLLQSVTLNQDIPEGYHLEVKVLCDAISARPDSNLKEVWKLTDGFNGLVELQ